MTKAIATFFYIGLLRPAPGSWGSAAAIPLAWLVHYAFGLPGFILATLALFGLGWWSINGYVASLAATSTTSGDHDPSEVVIDEVAGMFVTLLPLSAGMWMAGAEAHVFPWPGWVAGFVLFRIFDIWKPWIIGWADRRATPLGVMLDDIFAGVFAAIGMLVLAALYHLVLVA